jgi:putative tryptophan/tyrosine transport system substrate-binding protein
MIAMLKRREFITLLGGSAIALTFSPAASAQGRQARIGLLMPVSPPAAYLSAFREGLRERGYVEGQNLSIDVRWPPGSFEQNSGVVAELVRANVDVIVAWSTPALMAAGRATSTIPIVGVSISDFVGTGFVASLARPGGNVTGVTPINPDLSSKLVELLREIVPAMKHVGVLVNPANLGSAVQMPGVEDAARAMGLQLKIVEARTPEEFARGFARLSEHGVQGVVLLADPSFIEHRALIAELARNARLPTAFQRRENVEAGGLLAYGADNNDQFRQAAFYVDQILKGAKPADLPVQQPVKFELAVNLKTAKTLGLEVPPLLIARADEVIE